LRKSIISKTTRIAIPCAVVLVLLLAACGDADDPGPTGSLAPALSDIGGGGAHGSLGVGWLDPQRVDDRGLDADTLSDALLPNARTVVDVGPRLRRRFGFDPLSATRLISVGGSYAFGLRLDGVDASGLDRALIEAGGQARRSGSLQLIEVGDYAVVPEPLVDVGVRGLGAFDAFGHRLSVLAISDRARATLLGEGDRLIDEPIYAAAADCLGDIVAARLVPDKQIISTELGVQLVAAGVRREGHEVLCVLGGTPERADEVAASLEAGLAPEARDPVTRDPMRRSVESVDVNRESYDDVEVVRAEVTLTASEPPAYLFRQISSASVVAWINGTQRVFAP
jgi:hypothetical protein